MDNLELITAVTAFVCCNTNPFVARPMTAELVSAFNTPVAVVN